MEPTKRPTIGFLTYSSRGPVWAGCAVAARARNANLVGLAGWWLDDPSEYHGQANVLYDLASLGRLDGLVVWSSALGTYVGQEATLRFCERFGGLPLVSLGMTIPGAPSVLVDETSGIRQLVAHLVEVHGCRRIAYISGPSQHPELAIREQAYHDALSAYNLPWDATLLARVAHPDDGDAGAPLRALLHNGAPFDAVLVALGTAAPSVIDTLQSSGVRVPQDVIVVGFGQSFQTAVPLTAAAYPFYEQGRRATELLLDRIASRTVVEQVVLPLRLTVGETCGCRDAKVALAAVGGPGSAGSVTLAGPRPVALSRASMLADLRLLVGELAERLPSGWESVLLGSFEADLRANSSTQFLPALETTLVHAVVASRETLVVGGEIVLRGGDLGVWQQVVSVLRRWVRFGWLGPADVDRTEDLLHQARVLVGEVAQRAQAFHSINARESDQMARISHALSSTLHRHEMLDALARELPQLNIPGCYLALYADPARPTGEARLLLAVTPAGRVPLPAEGVPFPAGDLLPAELWPHDRCFTAVVEALYFRERQQGFVIFEAPQLENVAAQTLRAQISSSLAAAELFQHNLDLYNEADAARRQAEQADRLKSRFLSTVSHELRTPLTLLIGLSELLLSRPDIGTLPPAYAEDIERLYIGAQHLDRLSRDVLDLASSEGGQLRLSHEPLDMVETLHAVAVMGEQLAREKGLIWRSSIPSALPIVWGDRTRLRQVVLNLVANAVKFTRRGSVTLLAAEREGALIVEVHDTGIGVPLEEQGRVFDEFHRTPEAVAGFSGIGLGLTVARRLVELHGGRIALSSTGRPDEGAIFTIALPAAPALLAMDSAEKGLGAGLEGVLVLSPSGRSSPELQHYLQQQGYCFTELAFDPEGRWLNTVLAEPPGALILNWQPDTQQVRKLLDGLRSQPATQALPILFYALHPDQRRGGVVELELLTKPVDVEALARFVDQSGSERQRLLVVDDEPGLLDIHVRAIGLGFPNCEVLRANGGAEAWEIIKIQLPDLVILDLMMPGMDGFAVLEAMRSTDTTRAIPVVILTAQILADQDIARLNRGVAAVLAKGLYSLDETLAHIDAALRRTGRLGGEMQRMVRKAMAYIHEHYTQPIAREDLARHIGVSERYLTRRFAQETGVTPSTYLSRYRISQARKLLETTDRSITEIALEVGFSSTSYFGQVFRQQLGLTPQEYRARRG